MQDEGGFLFNMYHLHKRWCYNCNLFRYGGILLCF